jgi:hypothetical protein
MSLSGIVESLRQPDVISSLGAWYAKAKKARCKSPRTSKPRTERPVFFATTVSYSTLRAIRICYVLVTRWRSMGRSITGWTLPIRSNHKVPHGAARAQTLRPRQDFGGRSRVSEILNKKRKLMVEMMRSLRKHLAIPAESLLA